MDALKFLLSNGRSTEIPGMHTTPEVLVRMAVCASPSSTENSQYNSWNVSFSNGNTNGNNKFLSYAVRAVAALGEEFKEGWVAAFHDCCRNKKSGYNCNVYRAADWELDLWLLVHEVYTRTYQPRSSVCFIVTRPTLREIFAADFRDRIVQHWICLRLEPLFEQRHREQGDVSHNCRKGFGTGSAVAALERDIREVSEDYQREAWVGKIDVSSFFMSINTDILWGLLEQFIKDRYRGADIDTLLYLTELTVRHRPQGDCRRQSPPELWERLPPNKTLFRRDDGVGVAIGNITSQLEANFYMSYYVEAMMPVARRLGVRFEQFVDDIAFVAPGKEACLIFRDESRRVLRERLGLELHRNKFYLQRFRHGIKFVGQVIKPWRRYICNRTAGVFRDRLRRTEQLCRRIAGGELTAAIVDELRYEASSLNSYLGMMAHVSSYRLRRKVLCRVCPEFRQFFYTRSYAVVRIRRKYSVKQFLINKEVQNYGMDLHYNRSGSGRDQNASGDAAAHRQLWRGTSCRG